MKSISILTPDLSHNCLGRAHVLGELLEHDYDIEIVGPKLGETVWGPLRNEWDYVEIDSSKYIHSFPKVARGVVKSMSGDLIIASKPMLTSQMCGYIAASIHNVPILVDIDDWQSGFHFDIHGRRLNYLRSLPRLAKMNSFYYSRISEAITGYADGIIVSNTYLQDLFGGEIIPHARDENKFSPTKFDSERLRCELDLPKDKTLVMFTGTPRPHKGIEDLVRAVNHLDDDEIKSVIVGVDDKNTVNKLQRIDDGNMITKGNQPFSEIPKWLATADLIAIPQKDTYSTVGQIPAKIFDAMAMEKPVIATDVGDIPRVLGRDEAIVPASNPEKLANAIYKYDNNPSLRDSYAEYLRNRFLNNYSYEVISEKLCSIVDTHL